MVNNSINIIKTKETLNSDSQQFHQYYQNKRKFKQWWSTISLISSKQAITSHWTQYTNVRLVFSEYSSFLHWKWNIVESGIKRHNPNPKYKIMTYDVRNLGSGLLQTQKCLDTGGFS
jgi:hypothetical protein